MNARLMLQTATLGLFLTASISSAQEPLPQCEECSCFSACNQICIVQDHPGSHNEICDLWLCEDFPECQEASLIAEDAAFEPSFSELGRSPSIIYRPSSCASRASSPSALLERVDVQPSAIKDH